MTGDGPGTAPEEDYARADTVAALAGQLDGLRRDLAAVQAAAHAAATAGGGEAVTARVDALAARVDQAVAGAAETVGEVRDLAGTVERLAEAVTALSAKPRTDPAPTWMLLPADPGIAGEVLDGLAGWLRAVFLRYPDAAEALPECWCWHPDVVEELLWCMHAWIGAYHGPKASVGAAGDWHDRQRPGVVRRITAGAGTCSRERHQRRDGWTSAPTGAPTVPAEPDLPAIAHWWGSDRDRPAPEPPPRRRPRPVGRPHSPGASGRGGPMPGA